MNSLDDRISAALHAAVDGLKEQDLRPADPPIGTDTGRRPVRWVAPLLAAAAVVVAAAVAVAVSWSPSASHNTPPGGSPPPPEPSISTSASPLPPPALNGAQPLWPFATLEEADHWKNVEAANGHSPWHADAEATALFFASGYLQFHDIDIVTSSDIRGVQADIGVGYNRPNEGGKHTASVIHLIKFGDDSGPWEVVGATGTDISIDSPRAGDDVNSPITVRGHISGVDESIIVAVRSLDGVADTSEPVPGGGDDTEWVTVVPLSDRQHGTLTMVASTGGHLTDHERFTVVGVSATQ